MSLSAFVGYAMESTKLVTIGIKSSPFWEVASLRNGPQVIQWHSSQLSLLSTSRHLWPIRNQLSIPMFASSVPISGWTPIFLGKERRFLAFGAFLSHWGYPNSSSRGWPRLHPGCTLLSARAAHTLHVRARGVELVEAHHEGTSWHPGCFAGQVDTLW